MPRQAQKLWGLAAVAAVALYCVLLLRNVGAVAGASDSSGYMNHARLLAAGHIHAPMRTIPGLPQSAQPYRYLYVPLGLKPAWNGDGLVPTYPVGFPLFVLLVKPLVGWRHSGDAVIILHSVAGILAMFSLCQLLGLGRHWAALGAAIIALSPLYLFMSVQAMSDVPSLFWTTAAVIAALKSRERSPWALCAGAAVAMDVLLRPTNVIAFLPVGIALGLSPRRWLLLAVGGLPGAVFLGAHNMATYGALVTTGYGDSSPDFQAANVPGSLLHYLHWLPILFTPVVLFGLALPLLGGERARTRWLLGAWVVGFAAFYSSYHYTQRTWWFLRFVLPAAPAMVAAGLLVLRAIVSRAAPWLSPMRSLLAMTAAFALVGYSSYQWTGRLFALNVGDNELKYTRVCDWMRANVPPNAVCLAMQASGSLFYYTGFTFIRWDQVTPANVGEVEAAIRASHRPLYAVFFPYDAQECGPLEKRMPGRWSEFGKVDDVTIWRCDLGAAQP